jgi:hypothetical protein
MSLRHRSVGSMLSRRKRLITAKLVQNPGIQQSHLVISRWFQIVRSEGYVRCVALLTFAGMLPPAGPPLVGSDLDLRSEISVPGTTAFQLSHALVRNLFCQRSTNVLSSD